MSKPTNHRELTKELWKERVGPWPALVAGLLFFAGLSFAGFTVERKAEPIFGVVTGSSVRQTIVGNDTVLLVSIAGADIVQVAVANETPVLPERSIQLQKVTTLIGRQHYRFLQYNDI